jgi:hypothetical protein
VREIRSKKENYRLWQSGQFGNKLRAWPTIQDWKRSGFSDRVVLRTMLPAGGGPCKYDLQPNMVDAVVRDWESQGVPVDRIMVNEAAPDESAVLQGEYYNDVLGGYWSYLYYSHAAKHMREALEEGPQDRSGLLSRLLLKELMSPGSMEDWLRLEEQWPGHVFEISIYDRFVGDVPRRNVLVWEVRRY